MGHKKRLCCLRWRTTQYKSGSPIWQNLNNHSIKQQKQGPELRKKYERSLISMDYKGWAFTDTAAARNRIKIKVPQTKKRATQVETIKQPHTLSIFFWSTKSCEKVLKMRIWREISITTNVGAGKWTNGSMLEIRNFTILIYCRV